MTIDIKTPTFPESIADGTVATWHKKPGEAVKRDELIVDIETDKVVMEVLAKADGVIAEIVKNEGDTVLSGELLGKLTEGGAATAAPAAAEAPILSPAARKIAEENAIAADSITGTGKGGRVTKEDAVAAVEAKKSAFDNQQQGGAHKTKTPIGATTDTDTKAAQPKLGRKIGLLDAVLRGVDQLLGPTSRAKLNKERLELYGACIASLVRHDEADLVDMAWLAVTVCHFLGGSETEREQLLAGVADELKLSEADRELLMTEAAHYTFPANDRSSPSMLVLDAKLDALKDCLELITTKINELHTTPAKPDNEASHMSDITREELDAKLEATNIKVDARLASFENTVRETLAAIRLDSAEIRGELRIMHAELSHLKNIKGSIWGAAGATIVGIVGMIGAMLAYGVANFDAGRETSVLTQQQKPLEQIKAQQAIQTPTPTPTPTQPTQQP